jgi:streptomycin 6-kinase
VPPPPDCPLPDVASRLTAFDEYLAAHGDRGPLPADLVGRAAGIVRELCTSGPGPFVLHGDLHHDNVLRAGREPWLAIDPHGVVGDPGTSSARCSTTPSPPTGPSR